jgi:hypothetical protein
LTLAPTENLEFLRDGKFTVLTPDYLRNVIDEVRANGVKRVAKGGMAPVPQYLKKYVLQTDRIAGKDHIKVEITPESIKKLDLPTEQEDLMLAMLAQLTAPENSEN